mmetsp:Transcript_21800/g.24134  ORF Transcript_21800/g.24134 Transcript_21800/m.24134 type:complete len:140 (-) Transcript_21800:22-441(-)
MECLKLEDSFKSMKETLRIKRLVSITEDSEKLSSKLSRLATPLQEDNGQTVAAYETRNEMLKFMIKIPRKNQINIAQILLNLGELFYAQGQISKALRFVRQSFHTTFKLYTTTFVNSLDGLQVVVLISETLFFIGSLHF